MTGAQKKKIRRIMIAAPKSGSGKTTITCGLLQIFKENGEDISSCKCGPDYIDPMFHRQVLGVPSRNLDTFFTGEEGTRKLFLKDRREDELVVMEGVMGLYDGLGGIREEGSSYHLAKVTQTPILLVVGVCDRCSQRSVGTWSDQQPCKLYPCVRLMILRLHHVPCVASIK